MKPFYLLLLLSGISSATFAQITPEWAVTLQPVTISPQNIVNQIITDDQGNSYITGSVTDTSFTPYTWVFKYNTMGVLQWQVEYDSTYYFSQIDIDQNQNIFVAGRKDINGIPRIYLVKYDTFGTFLWERFYGTSGISYAWDVEVDDFGNAIVSGILNSTSHTLLKYDTAGNLLWWASDGPINGNSKTFMALDDNNDVYHAVRGWDTLNTAYKSVVYKYSNSGNKIWESFYPGNLPQVYSYPEGLVYKNGSLYIPTNNTDFINGSFAVVKLDTSGTFEWDYVYNKTLSNELTFGLDVDNNSNVYITGYLYPYSCNNDSIITIRVDSTGNSVWEKVIGTNDCSWDKPYDIEVDDLGYIYVGAEIPTTSGHSQYLTIKYDSSGTELWQANYTTNAFYGDLPHSLSTDPLGNVYISGVSSDTANSSFLTIKYGFSTGMEEITDSDESFLIYPNPFTDQIFVVSQNLNEKVVFRLFDTTGRELQNLKLDFSNSTFTLDLSGIESGFYIYEISGNGKLLQQGKVVAR